MFNSSCIIIIIIIIIIIQLAPAIRHDIERHQALVASAAYIEYLHVFSPPECVFFATDVISICKLYKARYITLALSREIAESKIMQ